MLSQLGSFNGFNQRRPVTLGVLKSTRIHHVRITMGKGKKDKFWLLYKRIFFNIYIKGFQRCLELAIFQDTPGSKGVKKGPRLSCLRTAASSQAGSRQQCSLKKGISDSGVSDVDKDSELEHLEISWTCTQNHPNINDYQWEQIWAIDSVMLVMFINFYAW